MTIKHGFFASSDPEDPISYDQPTFARARAIDMPDGITDGLHDNFAVSSADPAAMSVVVGGGHISIQGYWMESDADETLTIAAADADNPRIDRIVVRLDTITNLKVSLEVLTGTPASSPTVPALTQTASVYEIALAQVAVAAGVTSIVAGNITDERVYKDVTNLFHQPVIFQSNTIIQGDMDIRGNLLGIEFFMVGEMKFVAFPDLPSGWLRCDGSAVSRSTYAALFAKIGTSWGVGNGSTTFNLPDARNRTPVGAGTTYALGAKGGEATHTLTEAEMPTHYHNWTGTANYTGGQSTGWVYSNGTGALVTGQTTSKGSGTAHNNMPPFFAGYWIIKT